MLLRFNKRRFIAAFAILSGLWLLLNYLLFTRKGISTFHPDIIGMLEWTWNGLNGDPLRGFGNYMPIYPYFMYIYGLFFDNHDALIANAHWLKSFSIVVDAALFSFILGIINFKTDRWFWISLGLVIANFFLFYNSVFWGQVDCFHTFLLVLAFYSIVNKNLNMFGVFITLAILTKIVSAIFLPVFGIYLLNELLIKKVTIRQVAIGLVYAAATFVVAVLPIVLMGIVPEYLASINEIISNYDCISGNAFNVYPIISNRDDLISTSSETSLFKSLTFKRFGWFTFIIVTLMYFYPIFKIIFANLKKKYAKSISTETLLLMCVLMPLVFFFFSVKMRERYAHPFLTFFTIYCLYNRRYLIWLLASVVYFLQLEAVLQYLRTLGIVGFKLHEETHVFSPTLIAGLFLGLLIYIYHLFKNEVKASLI